MTIHRGSALVSVVALMCVSACSSSDGAGQSLPGNLGQGGATPNAGSSGAGAPPAGAGAAAGGSTGIAGAAGQPTSAGSGGAPAGGAGPSAGAGGALATGGADPGMDQLPTRPINVTPGANYSGSFNGQSLFVNKSKPAAGKLVLLLGGICTGTGAGGFESFVKQNGFHVFAPKTQTCVNGAPDKYKAIIKTTPLDQEANRQVADARVELWDGKDRVDWVTVNKGESIQEETVGAINYATTADPGGDWGYFLNADGTLRTSDVWVVGYSWGSQSWAMISSYVRFGRVIITSGPVDEGFPNGEWITHPAATQTPADRKYMLADLQTPYPSDGDGNMAKFANVIKEGWPSMVTSVTPNGMGTYTADQHLFAMIGSNGDSPGGHTVFCNDNAKNGWLPVCKHVMNLDH